MASAARPFLLFNQPLPLFPFIKCLFLPLLLPDPPQPPVINGLEGEEVQAGRTLLLQCVSYGGNPLAALHWTKVDLSCHLLWLHCQELLVTLSVPQNVLIICFFRTERFSPFLGRRTLRRRGPSALSTWWSTQQTIRQSCPVRAPIWWHCLLCLWAAKSLCSVSE